MRLMNKSLKEPACQSGIELSPPCSMIHLDNKLLASGQCSLQLVSTTERSGGVFDVGFLNFGMFKLKWFLEGVSELKLCTSDV